MSGSSSASTRDTGDLAPTDNESAAHFFSLIPTNLVALEAFNSVDEAIHEDPKRYDHIRQFIHFFPAKPAPEVAGTPQVGSPQKDLGTDSETGETPSITTPSLAWHGHWRFYYTRLPRDPRFGWRAGSGRNLQNGVPSDVDIWLDTSKNKGVRGSHALFRFREDHVFLIQGRHSQQTACPVIVKDRELYYDTGAYALQAPCTPIRLGQATYSGEWVQTNAHLAKSIKEEYFRTVFHAGAAKSHIPVTPPSVGLRIDDDWLIYHPIGVGSSSTFKAAVQVNTSAAAAVKVYAMRSFQDQKQRRYLAMFYAIREKLESAKHPFRDRIIKVIDHREPSATQNGLLQELYVFMSPLGARTLQDVVADKDCSSFAFGHRLALAVDILQGICALHSINYVHRDIKPLNILITSENPARAVIIDLEQAVELPAGHSLASKINSCGTVGYLAAEVESQEWGRYGLPVDIWSMGVILCDLFSPLLGWKFLRMNMWLLWDLHNRVSGMEDYTGKDMFLMESCKSSFLRYREALTEPGSDPLRTIDVGGRTLEHHPMKTILHQMLEPNPAARVSAEQALQALQTIQELGAEFTSS